MQHEIHPTYGPVVFRDKTAGTAFLTNSTLAGSTRVSQTIDWEDGNTYPVVDVDVSSASHPFYTGKRTVLDTAGQVSKFNARYGKK